MPQFINQRDAAVTEAIDGLLRISGDRLTRLDGYPHIKVILRKEIDPTKVALISGGGSGHEPAHGGFVGHGMLTAAVCGDVFASPSVEAVLAGILAATGEAGCLLIVKNYTGDRLNFGLAAERARALGKRVSMVVVDDDIALPDLPQPRGLAGTLFVHKIAGYLAEQGADLDAVTEAAQGVIRDVVSMGMSLDTCTVPGSKKEDRIPAGMAELGLGIHGEPGVQQVSFTDAREAMAAVVERLMAGLGDGQYCAMLNNLGGTTPLEMAILTEELCKSSLAGKVTTIIGPAPMMTSLDMRGFSISLLPMNARRRLALHEKVELTAWPGLATVYDVTTVPVSDKLAVARAAPSENAELRAFLSRCCAMMTAMEADLNALDARSGDGDTGSTLAVAAKALENALDRLPLADPKLMLQSIGLELAQTMGGSSGVLMAIFFSAAGDAHEGDMHLALKAGLERIQQVGGAQQGDRTMIDALAPALDALPGGLAAAADAARAGADATAAITRAKAGRAAYVSAAHLEGHNDPGAEAVARLFEGLASS